MLTKCMFMAHKRLATLGYRDYALATPSETYPAGGAGYI
jgi:hypothetical protein